MEKETQQSQPTEEYWRQKDKRISFLSIFSSLCNLYAKEIAAAEASSSTSAAIKIKETALKITDELFKYYPYPGEAQKQENPQENPQETSTYKEPEIPIINSEE